MLIKAETKMPFSEVFREDNSSSHWETKHFKLVLDVNKVFIIIIIIIIIIVKSTVFLREKKRRTCRKSHVGQGKRHSNQLSSQRGREGRWTKSN